MGPLSDAIYLSISPIPRMIYGAIVPVYREGSESSVGENWRVRVYGFINFARGKGRTVSSEFPFLMGFKDSRAACNFQSGTRNFGSRGISLFRAVYIGRGIKPRATREGTRANQRNIRVEEELSFPFRVYPRVS